MTSHSAIAIRLSVLVLGKEVGFIGSAWAGSAVQTSEADRAMFHEA